MFLYLFLSSRPRTVQDWQPRILLGMLEARSVNVKKTTTVPLLKVIPQNRENYLANLSLSLSPV